jgi:hypothetical protein
MILRMLQEKKLSIEEAEALLEALDQPVDLDETPRATERPDSD